MEMRLDALLLATRSSLRAHLHLLGLFYGVVRARSLQRNLGRRPDRYPLGSVEVFDELGLLGHPRPEQVLHSDSQVVLYGDAHGRRRIVRDVRRVVYSGLRLGRQQVVQVGSDLLFGSAEGKEEGG